jgi:hypothetical protein
MVIAVNVFCLMHLNDISLLLVVLSLSVVQERGGEQSVYLHSFIYTSLYHLFKDPSSCTDVSISIAWRLQINVFTGKNIIMCVIELLVFIGSLSRIKRREKMRLDG